MRKNNLIVKYDPNKNIVKLKDPDGIIDKLPLKEVQEIINDILSLVANAWADCAVKAFQEHEDKEARAWRRVSLIEAALILMMCIYRLIEVL